MSRDRSVLKRLVVLGGLVASGALFCCSDGFDLPKPCGTIPENGCPDKGQQCADPLCATLYSCTDGVWRFTMSCPFDPDAGDASRPEASAPVEAGFDPNEAKCPSLEEPDCPRSFARACTSGCCGCEDVFACENGEWSLIGGCTDGGLMLSP